MPPRFFVPEGLMGSVIGATIALPDAVAHHLRVTRVAEGAPLVLFDGTGGEYAARAASIDKRAARATLEAFAPVERESPLDLTLVQAIIASDAMDYAVRKAVEVGVAAITPLVTARSATLPAGERAARRVAHWQQIAVAACEQCGRNRVPRVHAPHALDAAALGGFAATYVCLPGARTALAAAAPSRGPVAVLIGPEGGWSDDEITALAARAQAVSLGPRVLRAETAAVVAIALLQSRCGDLGTAAE